MNQSRHAGTTTTYNYNGDGIRISKTTNNVTTNYIKNGMNVAADIQGNTTTFVYDNANVIEEITADSINKYYRGSDEIIKNNNDIYYLYNGQGDVAVLIDAAGASVADYVFDAYGNQSEENTIYNPFGYRGEYTDAESGLIYLRARMYDPQTGRFINEDPIMYGANWYSYCNGNPVMFADPWGMAPSDIEALYISEHIYGDYSMYKDGYDDRIIAGWRLIQVYNGCEGMKMGIYIPNYDDWRNPSEYVIAFKGSSTLSDWKNNIEQLVPPKSADMWDALGYGQAFVNSHSGYEITFVGHSKGGAEATSVAVSTNRNAMVFNPATSNFYDYGVSISGYTGSTTAYIVEGEIVNYLEGWFSRPVGNVVYLPQQYGKDGNPTISERVENHSIKALKMAFLEVGRK